MPATPHKPTLLVVEDDLDVAEMLVAYFHDQGYDVQPVHWGEDAVEFCRANTPDLILLDIRLPDIDGYEVARQLRASRRTVDCPIIFLTEKRQRADRLQGLALGGDDYITKPFDIQELGLRVRNALRRGSQEPLTNQVTGLPEGALVDERLGECLKTEGWSIILVSIQNITPFRESYGFVVTDDMLRAVGLMIKNAVRELGGSGDFIGQVCDTDFLVLTTPHHVASLTERIQLRLDQTLMYFYPLQDREQIQPIHHKLGNLVSHLSANAGPFYNIAELKQKLRGRRR